MKTVHIDTYLVADIPISVPLLGEYKRGRFGFKVAPIKWLMKYIKANSGGHLHKCKGKK